MKKNYLENIKTIRTDKGINQSQMAESLGFTQNNYSKIERGIGELSVDRLYEIAEILGVSIFQILIEKDVELLQEKIRVEIQTKQKNEFQEKRIEEIKTKHKEEFKRELEEEMKNWFSNIGEQFKNLKLLPKTPENGEKKKRDKFEGLS